MCWEQNLILRSSWRLAHAYELSNSLLREFKIIYILIKERLKISQTLERQSHGALRKNLSKDEIWSSGDLFKAFPKLLMWSKTSSPAILCQDPIYFFNGIITFFPHWLCMFIFVWFISQTCLLSAFSPLEWRCYQGRTFLCGFLLNL